ncbi:MAG TPA: class I SAM-dependent methyltransferase [Solirubrobacteraceae bacterium]
MSSREWDGKTYDRISAPMEQMGLAVLDRLPLTGDETVLDAGCGSGRVTEALIERLPNGRVIGVDGSAAMIAAARERLGPAVDLRVQDLLALDVEPVDAILSTATFHWIKDHDALFRRLYGVLRPGGRLVAQCGGEGQAAAVHAAAEEVGAREPYASSFAGWVGPWHFADAESTERRLRAAGFTQARAWLQVVPMETPDGEEWLRTIMLGTHLERLPADLRDGFVGEVGAILGVDPLRLDYVRLNIDAAR